MEAVTNAMQVITFLAAFANVHRKAHNLLSVIILMGIHCAVIAKATHELIVAWSHWSKTIVTVVGDGGSVYFKGVRALHKLPHICNTQREQGEEEGPEITVTRATRLTSKHTTLPPDTKIVTSSNLTSGPFSYHPQHRSQRWWHEKGHRSASG